MPNNVISTKDQVITETEVLKTEQIFISIEEINVMNIKSQIKLRDRLVWFCMFSFFMEMLLMFLHSYSVISLPYVAQVAISASMGGSSLGLGGLLLYIARYLFSNSK